MVLPNNARTGNRDTRTVIVISKAPPEFTKDAIKTVIDEAGFAVCCRELVIDAYFAKCYSISAVLSFSSAKIAEVCCMALKAFNPCGAKTKILRTSLQTLEERVTRTAQLSFRRTVVRGREKRVCAGATRAEQPSKVTAVGPSRRRARSVSAIEERSKEPDVVLVCGEYRLVCKKTFVEVEADPCFVAGTQP